MTFDFTQMFGQGGTQNGFQNGLWNPWGMGNPFGSFGQSQQPFPNPFAGGMGFQGGQGFDFSSLLGTAQPAPVLPPVAPRQPNARPPELTRQEKIYDTLRNPNSKYNKELGRVPWGAR